MPDYMSAGQAARELGVLPRDVTNLFYLGKLRDDLAPVVAGRRMIPRDYLPMVKMALVRAGKIQPDPKGGRRNAK